MNMKEFSSRVGLSAHTLRYYEKIGLLRHVHRNSSGHRVYSTKDLDWMTFVLRLKETGMPLDEILTYAELRALGSDTVLDRQRLLEQHREALKAKIEHQLNHLSALDDKIALYKANKVS